MRRLLACFILAGFVGPAAACINDIELPAHEREFRSQYRGPAALPPSPSTYPTNSPAHPLLAGIGITLLAGATALAWTGGKRRS